MAQHRLGELVGKLRRPDPLRAVGEALTSRSFDELIISTLTQRGSRRLGISPNRLHRHGLPVTDLIAKT